MKNRERSLSSYLKTLVSFVKIQNNIFNQSLWPWCLGINIVAGSPVWTLISDGFQRILRRLEMIQQVSPGMKTWLLRLDIKFGCVRMHVLENQGTFHKVFCFSLLFLQFFLELCFLPLYFQSHLPKIPPLPSLKYGQWV